MNRKQKFRKTAINLSAVILMSSALVLQSNSGGTAIIYAAEQKTNASISHEEAVRFAQKWVEIPSNYKIVRAIFLGEYNDYHDQELWKIAWSNKKGSSCTVYIDASTGKLLSYSSYSGVAKNQVNEEVALEKAKQFLQRAIGTEELKKLSKPNEYEPILSYYFHDATDYAFTFTRVENQIPFIENGFEIVVGRDGEIQKFYREWREGDIPTASQVISVKDAQSLMEGISPTLINKELYSMTKLDSDREKYQLVYGYSESDPQFIDARTGSLINARGKAPTEKRIQALGRTFPANEAVMPLKIVTQEEAQKIAEKYSSHFPGTYQVDSKGKNGDNWSFTFSPLDETDQKKKPIKLLIKSNGEIMEYISDGQTDLPVKKEGIPYAMAEGKAIKLVKTLYGDRLGEIYVMEPYPYDTDTKKIIEIGDYYTVRFGWMKDGVPIENVKMEVLVNPKTGEAEYLGTYGNSKPLRVNQSGAGIVDPEVAKKVERENKRLILTYYDPRFGLENDQIMLVYRYIGDQGVVDAHTGKWLSFREMWKVRAIAEDQGGPK